jgi:hypothetical protein
VYLLGESHLFRDASDRLPEDMNGNKPHIRQPRKICSCCAVEGVTETGIEVVRCLDCVKDHPSHWQTLSTGQQRLEILRNQGARE